MPSQATADAASESVALYHADGWLDETLNRWQDILRVDVREIDVRGGRGGPHPTIEMRLVLRDGRGIRLRPRYWLTSASVAEQPTYQRLEALPSAATPVGRALERWAPQVPVQSTA